MGKSQGTPLLAAGGNGPASPANGCVKPRLAFSLESPLDESGDKLAKLKLKSFPSEAPGLARGDSLRAKNIAETMLEKVLCFTGRYQDKKVSVMGSGMGIPTLSIYVYELVTQHDVKTPIRVGTCGALQPYLKVGDVVLAMSSSTNLNINRPRFAGMDYAPTASFQLLLKAYEAAKARGITVYVGSMFSSDTFYDDDPDWWKI